MIDLNKLAHSNDYLEIINRGHQTCVRKTFNNDVSRASKSVEKQRSFRPIYTGSARVSAAEVLDYKIYDDRAELVMPYVEGLSGRTFAIHATRNVASTLSLSLSTLLYFELNNSTEKIIDIKVFDNKLAEVIDATEDEELRSHIEKCKKLLRSVQPSLIFPIGPCHGDLTLGNIILDPLSGVTLIDFLQTYIESPLQDIAKLKQDFIFGWSFRKESPSLKLKAEILCSQHTPKAICQIERMYPVQIGILTMMSLVRICPYVKDESSKKWVITSINKFLKDSL